MVPEILCATDGRMDGRTEKVTYRGGCPTYESDFYELWQQHKQVKTMEMNQAWPDIYVEGYIHQFQPGPTHKFTSSSRSTKFKDILHGTSLKWSQRPSNQHKNSHKLSYMGHPVWWKVNGTWYNHMIRIFQWRECHCRTNTSVRRKKSKWAVL